jgi:hypothetical protein
MESLTWSAFIALLISAIVSYLFHNRMIARIYKLEQNLLDQQHENDRLLTRLNFELQHRQKSQIVADLFSKWSSPVGMTAVRKEELNKLSYECALWLPESIMEDLNQRLTNNPNSKQLQQILVDVRQFLNPEIGPLDWSKIVYWP